VFSSMLYMENTEQRGTGIKNGSEWSNGTVHFDRTGPTEKSGPPRKVDRFFRNFSGWTELIHSVLDRNFRKFWFNGSRPVLDLDHFHWPTFLIHLVHLLTAVKLSLLVQSLNLLGSLQDHKRMCGFPAKKPPGKPLYMVFNHILFGISRYDCCCIQRRHNDRPLPFFSLYKLTFTEIFDTNPYFASKQTELTVTLRAGRV